MKKIISIPITLILLLSFFTCADSTDSTDNKKKLLFIALMLDPCFSTTSPVSGSGLSSVSLAAYNAAAVKGRVVTAGGAPVIGALVIVDDVGIGSRNNAVHYSTHSSINRDGSFELSGIDLSAGTTFRLAVEPVNHASFGGRIDMHLDCFTSPLSFTSGWYTGNGATISTNITSAASFTLSAGEVKDLGTVKLLE